MTTTPFHDVPDLITQLKAKQAALGDCRDCGSDYEKAAFVVTYNAMQSCITALMNLPDDIAKRAQQLADAEFEHNKWTASHQELRESLDAKRLEGDVHAQELQRRHTYVQHFSDRITALRVRRDCEVLALEHNIKLAHELLTAAHATLREAVITS